MTLHKINTDEKPLDIIQWRWKMVVYVYVKCCLQVKYIQQSSTPWQMILTCFVHSARP